MFERNDPSNNLHSSWFPESTLSECLQTMLKSGALVVVIVERLSSEEILNCGPGK